ncbi:MAG: glycine dehydrogenase (aminomethyl-transferring), partial [Acidobacteria bacterium]|nr:glycine dehydrogenase (aminomethyl-transferring) [Acidobacteriota bacterium]
MPSSSVAVVPTLSPVTDTNAVTGVLDFTRRHIGPSPSDIQAMLATVGAASMQDLIAQTVPHSIRQKHPLDLGQPGLSETEALAAIRAIAAKNQVFTSLLGMGYHGTHLPLVILRNILENPAWYTAYTPYQPEISQGRLEALLNYQTLITDLTRLDVANASLLDEATAGAEAMAICKRGATSKSNRFFVDQDVHPQTLAVVRQRAEPLGWTVITGDPTEPIENVFGALFQYPGSSGRILDFRKAIAQVHAQGGLTAMSADPLALVLLTPPGELGADIAVGSMQRYGVPMGYGGPHAAYMAVKESCKRYLPGRLVGVSIDARGNRASRLALQTREQHIRREKATSNICTAQVLLAVIASMYAVYHGPEGLKSIASAIRRKTAALAKALGVEVGSFFDTITVQTPGRQREIIEAAAARKTNLRPVGTDAIGIAIDETTTVETLNAVLEAFGITGKIDIAAEPAALPH